MGKRTSDFMAIAAIFGGAGLGLGLSGLFVAIPADRAPNADDSSIEVRVLRRNIIMGPRQVDESTTGAPVVHRALIVESDRSGVANEVAPFFRLRTRARRSRSERQRWGTLRGEVEVEVEDIRLEAREMVELKKRLFEALSEVEALEDLDVGENVTIDIRRDGDDKRRRRRRPR